MNPRGEEEGDEGEVFLDEDDVIQEIHIDEEDLPDGSDDADPDSPGSPGGGDDDSIHTFTGHTGEVYSIACNPIHAPVVATGGGDDRGFLWQIGSADWNIELKGHGDSVSSLAFSTDGQLLASGSLDGLVQVWDTLTGSLKGVLEGPGGGIEWIKWHPRGHIVLAGSEDSTAWMWNADKCAFLNMFTGHAGSVTCGAFTPDGKSVCTGSDDASLRIWNPKTGENVHVVRGNYVLFYLESSMEIFLLSSKFNSGIDHVAIYFGGSLHKKYFVRSPHITQPDVVYVTIFKLSGNRNKFHEVLVVNILPDN